MNDIRLPLGKRGDPMRWMTRLFSLVVSCVFLLIAFLAVTDEDKLQGAAISVPVLLVLTIAACFAAWRWEKVGGVIVVIGALCLGVATCASSLTVGLGSMGCLPSLIYSVPFLVVGILFWISGKSNDRLNQVEQGDE